MTTEGRANEVERAGATGRRVAWPGLLLVIGIGWILAGPIQGERGAASVGSADRPALQLIPVTRGDLEEPLYLTHAGDGTGALFIVEQGGRIRVLPTAGKPSPPLKRPFLDLTDRVLSGGERGLLGLAFHPRYRTNGRFFVNYTRKPDGATVIAEFARSPRNPLVASPDETILMVVDQPYANHNGGMVSFGPDGYLYIGLGDGGSSGDPQNRAQNRQERLGKILRIDVDRGKPFAIPPDNPFATSGGRPEIYALGLRNPWRFSFDRQTGELWAGDVGQYRWEEIDLIAKGGNYGWRVMEGTHCFSPPDGCEADGLILPVAEYGHESGRCSIIGGYVYRGSAMPEYRGVYFYADYCSGEVFDLVRAGPARSAPVSQGPHVALKTGVRISSFGEDAQGELYVVDHGGGVYRLAASR
ncbi:MAG TPA: PQQ-dependent sugar dehydrogenase [Nitrospiraceae bacterium]|nr:PQQ-dependent sugar dehydrogenase [Nitrospiraceae bacterium]